MPHRGGLRTQYCERAIHDHRTVELSGDTTVGAIGRHAVNSDAKRRLSIDTDAIRKRNTFFVRAAPANAAHACAKARLPVYSDVEQRVSK
jgi:hypothetical protein